MNTRNRAVPWWVVVIAAVVLAILNPLFILGAVGLIAVLRTDSPSRVAQRAETGASVPAFGRAFAAFGGWLLLACAVLLPVLLATASGSVGFSFVGSDGIVGVLQPLLGPVGTITCAYLAARRITSAKNVPVAVGSFAANAWHRLRALPKVSSEAQIPAAARAAATRTIAAVLAVSAPVVVTVLNGIAPINPTIAGVIAGASALVVVWWMRPQFKAVVAAHVFRVNLRRLIVSHGLPRAFGFDDATAAGFDKVLNGLHDNGDGTISLAFIPVRIADGGAEEWEKRVATYMREFETVTFDPVHGIVMRHVSDETRAARAAAAASGGVLAGSVLVDADGDGLPDIETVTLDEDHDGVPDDQEIETVALLDDDFEALA
ncbi:hypothetical protein OMK64_01775 [Cellulomonas fimi]|uniref:hypothetical protein n=1 Tax=Cellulomonas fimi TaxID=1708 RepID=UPI00234E0FA5|nr:hypothetical protein [Cellulomonas fimi]MDC7120261.1 hypothetical protein [Cellulomonas fimi]